MSLKLIILIYKISEIIKIYIPIKYQFQINWIHGKI